MIDRSTKIVDLAARAGGRLSTDSRGRLQIHEGVEERIGHDDDHQAFLLHEAAAIRAKGGELGREHIEALIAQLDSALKSLAAAIRGDPEGEAF